MPGPKPHSNILEITPYKGGQKLASGWKLSSNENPLGCSAAAQRAIVGASQTLALYPDGGAVALREAIGQRYQIDPARIICGAGSDEIFQLLGRAYLAPGDEILQSEHGFLVYRLVAQQSGAVTVSAPETDLKTDVDALLERVSPRTRIVFVANPNNPTGTYINKAEIERLHAGLPEDVLLVLDGAYAEYVCEADYSDGMHLAANTANVLVTRTFSKIHGLAALRLGWAYGPESVIDALNRTRGPFNVSSVAQAAGIAALGDKAFEAKSRNETQQERDRLFQELTNLGMVITPSVANFLLIHFGREPGQTSADADQFLRSHGIVARNVDVYGLPYCLRLTVGTSEANRAVISAFEAFLDSK